MTKCKKHVWEILSKDILPSAYEQIAESGYSVNEMRGSNNFQKKLILVLVCQECGELDKTVEVNP